MQNFCNGVRGRGWNQPIILPRWPLSAEHPDRSLRNHSHREWLRPNAAGTSAHGTSTPIPLSEYENIRVGALKARPSSKHPEESDQKSH